jgi:hypothetical protein
MLIMLMVVVCSYPEECQANTCRYQMQKDLSEMLSNKSLKGTSTQAFLELLLNLWAKQNA